MVSYAELGAEPLPLIWQELRALRSRKVGAATGGDRRETFDAALEQSEQLFAAAARVGIATQPILLFYGLSQMGRALAAASPLLSKSEYSFSGHGLTDGQLQGAASQGLANLMIRGEERGAFPRVAKALAASSIEDPVRLGDLWALLPYSDRFPVPDSGSLQRLLWVPEGPGYVSGHSDGLEYFDLYGLPTSLQIDVPDPNLVEGEIIDKEWELLKEYLATYPTLKGWQPQGRHQRVPYVGQGSSLGLALTVPRATGASAKEPERAPAYHGAMYVYPRLDESDLPAHPFMLWWAVLFPLSRLARYYPNVWTKLTSISSNAHAAPVEFILREALRAVPELGLRAIARFG